MKKEKIRYHISVRLKGNAYVLLDITSNTIHINIEMPQSVIKSFIYFPAKTKSKKEFTRVKYLIKRQKDIQEPDTITRNFIIRNLKNFNLSIKQAYYEKRRISKTN